MELGEFLGRGWGQAVIFGLGATVRFAPTLWLLWCEWCRYDEQLLPVKPLRVDLVGRCAYSTALCNQPFEVGFLISSIACERAYLNHRTGYWWDRSWLIPSLSVMTTLLWTMS